MKTNMTPLEYKNCQKLLDLFKAKLSISDRSYYENLKRLDNYLKNFRKEMLQNCIGLPLESRRTYYALLLHKLTSITIVFDENFFQHKLKKYQETPGSFPELSNDLLKQQFQKAPSRCIDSLDQEELARHTLNAQLQKVFFKFWMSQKKEEVQNEIRLLIEESTSREVVGSTHPPDGLTLNQIILFLDETGVLAPLDDMFMENLPAVLAEVTRRPKNKIKEKIIELDHKPSSGKQTARNSKDRRLIAEYIQRNRRDL